MADNDKKYYWLKLKEGFFKEKEIKKLRRIAGGDTYTIIYLKLMLLSLRDAGRLYYDGIEDTFYEELALEIDEEPDNVKVTLIYLQRMGLMEEISSTEAFLTRIPETIGSETSKAELMRKSRARKKALEIGNNVTDALPAVTNCYTEIDIEKKKDIDKEIEIECIPPKSPKGGTRFTKPTLEEVQDYCRERGNKVDAEKFYDHYTSNGWRVGKNPMKDWKAAVRTWERTSRDYDKGTGFATGNPFLEMLEEERGR